MFVIAIAGYGQGLANLKLSEVFVSGNSSLQNEDGEHVAWLEIANVSWSSTNVGGCYLTNDRRVLDESLTSPQRIALMSQIPGGDARTNLAPKGHMVFFADGAKNLGTLHATFKLTSGTDILRARPWLEAQSPCRCTRSYLHPQMAHLSLDVKVAGILMLVLALVASNTAAHIERSRKLPQLGVLVRPHR